MSKSNDNRVEARECIRKANRCDDSQNRWAWLVLAKSWLLLADRQEIAENGFEASGQKLLNARPTPPPWSVEEQDACFIVKGQQAMVANHFL